MAKFAANNAVSKSSKITPFFANKGFYPRLSLDLSQLTSNQEAQDLAQHMNDIIKQLRANLLMFQEAQKSAANIHRTLVPAYQVGDQVWLNSRNIRTQRPSKKLDDKWIGPFSILELIGKRACRLELPESLQIHPVFYVSLLCPIAQDLIPGQSNQRSGPIIGTDIDDQDIYKVESVIDSQAPYGWQKFKYLVK